MLYEYTAEENHNVSSKHADKTFYVIGGMMLLGGLVSLLDNYLDTEPTAMGAWIVNSITALGGLAFIHVQYKRNKLQPSSSIFSIFMDDEKIKILSEYGNKCEEVSYSDISKIDFQENTIYLYSESSSQIKINLSLINSKEKKTELRYALTKVWHK